MTTNAKIYCSISKVDEEQRMVEGYASTESLDSQGEVVTRGAISGALTDYMKFANVREMHQASAVGKTKSATLDDKGLFIAVKVVDDVAWKKVKEGVYNGFSIGGTATMMEGNRIEGLRLSEISLVDRPACPDAVFTLWKSDGAPMTTTATPATPEPKKALTKADIQAGKDILAEAMLAKSCGLYSVSNLAAVLDQLSWITSDSEWEKQYEGDDSKVPEMLRQGYAQLADALKAMAAEETSETTAELAAQANANEAIAEAEAEAAATVEVTVELSDKPAAAAPVKKEDAAPAAAADTPTVDQSTLSDTEKAALKVVMELLQKAGLIEMPKPAADAAAAPAEDDAAKAAQAELAKADAANKDGEALAKLNGEVETLRKRVAELEAQPAATTGVLRVVNRNGEVEKVLTVQDLVREGKTDPKSALAKMYAGEVGQEPIIKTGAA